MLADVVIARGARSVDKHTVDRSRIPERYFDGIDETRPGEEALAHDERPLDRLLHHVVGAVAHACDDRLDFAAFETVGVGDGRR